MNNWSDDWEVTEYEVDGGVYTPPYSSPTPSGGQEESSILGTAWEKIKLQHESLLAAQVTDPEISQYAKNQYTKQYQNWQKEYNKLGTMSQIGSDIVGAAPAIAAFVSTPITGLGGLAAGAALSGTQATADALQAQYEEGSDWNMRHAVGAGAATAVTDLALGGLGTKAAGMAARKFAAPGAVGVSSAMRGVAPVATDVLVADSGSAAASQIYQNLASGRNWNENIGTAALIGAGAGGAIRGAVKGSGNLSQSLGFDFNKGGEGAAARAASVNMKNGTEANSDFMKGFVDKENAAEGLRSKISEMDVDDPDLGANISAYNGLMSQKAGDAAIVDFAEMIPDLHINTKGFDVNVGGKNVGRDILNMSQDTMNDAKINTSRVKKSFFQTKRGESKEGLSQEAFDEKVADTYEPILQKGRGNLTKNQTAIEEEILKAQQIGAPATHQEELRDLLSLYKEMISTGNQSMKSPAKSVDVTDRMTYLSNKFRDQSIKLGMGDQFTGFSGRKGDYEPLRDFMLEKAVWDSAHAQSPSFANRTADSLKDTGGDKFSNVGFKVGLGVMTGGLSTSAAAARRAYRRSKARGSLEQAQTMGRTLRRPTPSERMESELASGNGPAAAHAAADDLNAHGIDTPPPSSVVDAPPASPDFVETPASVISDEPSVAAQRVREQLIAEEKASRAPVTPVESVPTRTKADAKTRPAPRPKSIEEPVQAAAPKAEAKAASAPKESAKAKKDKARAEREAKKQAEQARIAADLQERILAGNAPRAKAAKTPTAKAVEEPTPIVEEVAPTPASVEAPKPEAKAAKAPTAKVVEEAPVVEAPAVEAPVKAEAKATKAPQESVKEKRAKARKERAERKKRQAEEEAAKKADEGVVVETTPVEAKGRKEPTRKAEEEITEEVVAGTTPVEAKGRKEPTRKEEESIELVHGSTSRDLTLDSIEIVRTGQKQGKKGRSYGGFYNAMKGDDAQASGYANMSEGTPSLYDVKLKPGSKVFEKEGDITRLSESYINDLKAQGYAAVRGKDPRGNVEVAVIDKDAIGSMSRREEPLAPKPEAKAARVPKKKEATQEPVVAQEAPQKAPTEPLGRKQPTRTQEEPEAVTEAPVKPEETVAESPKTDYAKLIREPLRKIIDSRINARSGGNSSELIAARRKAQEDLKTIRGLEQQFSKYPEEDISRVIYEVGGMEALKKLAKEDGMSVSQKVHSRLQDMERLRKQEASLKIKEMEELASKVKSKESSAREAEAQKLKDEESLSAEESFNKLEAAKQKEFVEEMDARGYDDEIQAPIREMLKSGTSIKNARIHAARLHKEKGERIQEGIKDNKEKAAAAKKVTDLQGQKDQVDQYLQDTGADDIPGVKDRIKDAFSNAQGPLSGAQMKKLVDGIQKHIDGEAERFKKALARTDKADPRSAEYEAAGLIYSNAQKTLASNRTAVDDRMAKAIADEKEATRARQVLESDYDKLFREADTRDHNVSKVISQKEELREDLLNRKIPESQVEEIIDRTFLKRERSPLSDKEMQKVILKTVDDVTRDRASTLENKVRAIRDVVKNTDDETLKEMTLKATSDISLTRSREEFEQVTAMARAMEGEVRERGMKKEATRLEAFNKAIIEGLENKTKYPNNPELWVPANYLKAIQSTFGEGTGSHAGGMWTTIKMIVTGDTEGLPKFGTKELGEMKSLQAKQEKLEMGKLLTGMDNIILK